MTFLRIAVLVGGFAFLYGPIVILAAMSFNASRLVSVWGGFSTRWYAELFQNAQPIGFRRGFRIDVHRRQAGGAGNGLRRIRQRRGEHLV